MGKSTTRLPKNMGISGQAQCQTFKGLLSAAKKASWWLYHQWPIIKTSVKECGYLMTPIKFFFFKPLPPRTQHHSSHLETHSFHSHLKYLFHTRNCIIQSAEPLLQHANLLSSRHYLQAHSHLFFSLVSRTVCSSFRHNWKGIAWLLNLMIG